MRKRNHQIKVWLSDDEYESFKEKLKSTGRSQQSFIINAINDATITTDVELLELKDMNKRLSDYYRQIRGMGVNINQTARIANTIKSPPESELLESMASDIAEEKEELSDIWRSLKRLIQAKVE